MALASPAILTKALTRRSIILMWLKVAFTGKSVIMFHPRNHGFVDGVAMWPGEQCQLVLIFTVPASCHPDTSIVTKYVAYMPPAHVWPRLHGKIVHQALSAPHP